MTSESSDSGPEVQDFNDVEDDQYVDDDDEQLEDDEELDGDNNEQDQSDEALRLELSQTPFEELLKLKDKLGTKAYNQTIVSKLDKNFAKNKNNKNQSFKRANKNRPQEISSKKPINVVREVFVMKKKTEDQLRRDPRFEEQSGRFSQNVFDTTYSFLKEKKIKEMNDLKKLLKKTKDEDKRKELSDLLQRLKNQQMAEEIKDKKKQIETNVRKNLNEEMGTKKTFVNKSTLKRLELADRFKQLKKSGKLKKYMEKKRKRNAMRERKKMPNNRQ